MGAYRTDPAGFVIGPWGTGGGLQDGSRGIRHRTLGHRGRSTGSWGHGGLQDESRGIRHRTLGTWGPTGRIPRDSSQDPGDMGAYRTNPAGFVTGSWGHGGLQDIYIYLYIYTSYVYICIYIYIYIYIYKVSSKTLGTKFECQSISTAGRRFQTRTDISARRPESPEQILLFPRV